MKHLSTAFAAIVISFCSWGLSVVTASDVVATPSMAASIPFASENIFNWQADGEKGIWVQAVNRRWYYATFMSPCDGLPFREGVHFKLAPSGDLDRWGAAIIPHFPECFFKTFSVSDGPPRPKKAKPPAVTAPTSNLAPSADSVS